MKTTNRVPFRVQEASGVEKYRQIVDGVIEAIRRGAIKRGERLPSASTLFKEFGLAKETVIKAYAILRERGVIHTVPRKGYFAATESVGHVANVMLLFDEFPAYKQAVYDSFMKRLGERVHVDIFFHHCTPALFEKLLLDNINHYDLAIVMPFAENAVGKVLGQVDPRKILILDRREYAGEQFSYIAHEFEESTYNCLVSAADLLKPYRKIYLVFPQPAEVAIKSSQAPREIINGLVKFCREHRMSHDILHDLKAHPVRKGDVVFVIDDADLVTAVEMARSKNLVIGRDVGILSYNDTPVKRVIDKGITVISTDFAAHGRMAAEYVLSQNPVKEIIPTTLIRRNSL